MEKLSIGTTGPLWRESTGQRWIPLTKNQLCGFFFVFFAVTLNKLFEEAVELPVTWNTEVRKYDVIVMLTCL